MSAGDFLLLSAVGGTHLCVSCVKEVKVYLHIFGTLLTVQCLNKIEIKGIFVNQSSIVFNCIQNHSFERNDRDVVNLFVLFRI